MSDVQLLDKTEIWVTGITVFDADLPSMARQVAAVLALPAEHIFVTDIGAEHVCFDVLIANLPLESFAGKQAELLAALAAIPGVKIAPSAAIHSDGILGLIGAPRDSIPLILDEAKRMASNFRDYTSRRVAVVSTGSELLDGRVRDTNLAAVLEIMGSAGFEVESGGIVGDDLQMIGGRVARLVSEGFGIVITTGGVGAEAKDKTVEALELLDSNLATAILASFQKGHGRHVKSAIRIAVARVGDSIAVALPGPTHEVRLALPILIHGLHENMLPGDLVEALATPLRLQLPHGQRAHATQLPPA